jgi:hypothetical protein
MKHVFYKLIAIIVPLVCAQFILMLQSNLARADLGVGPNINVSQRGTNQAETTIAINPTNPLNLIVGSNSLESGLTQDLIWFSVDGGLTWTQVAIPNPPGTMGRGDPSIVFDRQGTAYYSHLVGSSPFFCCDVAAAVSTNGGQNWAASRVTTDSLNDKNFFGVGPDINDLTRDRVYVGYQKLGVQYVQSTIDGINWSGEVRVSDPNNNGINIQLAVDDTGVVYAAWQGIRPPPASGISDIFFDVSFDGGQNWGTDTVAYISNVAAFRDPFTGSTCGTQYCVPAAPDRGIGAFLSLKVDRSGGPFNGRIYMVVVDQGDLDNDPDSTNAADHHDTDVFLLFSDDRGQSWTGPVRVNDDATRNSQFLPWMDVDQTTGIVAVGWYDTRNDDGTGGPGDTNGVPNDDVQFFVSASRDGGVTFLPNVQVSSGTTNENGAEPYPAGFANFDYGEYPGVAIRDGRIHVVWADNSNSTGDNPDGTLSRMDIYYAQVLLAITPTTEVAIAIRPRIDPNRINPNSTGHIRVAILSGNGFDATTVLPNTIRFGATGTESAPVNFVLRDVDGDGDRDMILRFLIQETGIKCGQTSALLTGTTSAGQLMQGSDSIKTVRCN